MSGQKTGRSKETREAILSSVGEGVVVIDLEGRIVIVNAPMKINWLPRWPIGQELWKFIAAKKYAEIEAMQDSLIDSAFGMKWLGDENTAANTTSSSPSPYEMNAMKSSAFSQRDVTQQKELTPERPVRFDVSHHCAPTTNISLYLELMETATDKQVEYLAVLKNKLAC
jgi:hypothetical protein